MPGQPDGYLSVADVAATLGEHPQTIRNRINDGTIPAVNYGGEGNARRLFVAPADLEAYRAARLRPAVQAAS